MNDRPELSAELREIRDHIARFAPFDRLEESLLDEVAASVEVQYFRADTIISEYGDPIHALRFIRSGAVEIYRQSGELYHRLGEGDIFGHYGLLRNNRVRFAARAIEDTLLYLIPDSVFGRLCEQNEPFADFVELSRPRLKAAVEQVERDNDMMVTRVRTLVTRPVIATAGHIPVAEAARRMTAAQSTYTLIYAEDERDAKDTVLLEQAQTPCRLTGILTDKDLRERVVARELPPQTPVREITADVNLVTIQSDDSVYEAMLRMLRNNIEHLPVLNKRRLVGVVALSDIVRHETNSSLYLVSSIFRQPSVGGLAQLAPDVRAAFVRLVDEGATAQMVGHAMSTVMRSVIRRLVELATDELGPPPIPYCLMINGALARHEPSINTDQDHGMVLDDRFDPARHDAYFEALATRISDGLAGAGYPYCKGGIMATNPRWRQPLSTWRRYFSEWIKAPAPEPLLHSSIFFDLDAVAGEERLVEALQEQISRDAPAHPGFLAALARNSLSRTPPLGFFRTFVLETDGKQNRFIDLKSRGTAPMTGLIQVHALAAGSRAQNSFERLDDIAAAGWLPAGQTEQLRYALEVIAMARIRHQAEDIRQERTIGNRIDPEVLSAAERHTLKDAFQVLSNAQKFLRFRYPTP
ncbi:MAG: DUF294 nucleotidyltransferase-like domain-containing protein [Halothiobacillaceae bacterium]